MVWHLKNIAAFWVLLSSSLPLSAGWEQRLCSALPKIALGTEISRRMHSAVSRYRHTEDVKKNTHTYADTSATEYVTNFLRERKAIEHDHIVYARWGDCYAMYSDALLQIPRNPESAAVIEENGSPEIGILHEEGHRQNRDSQKRELLTNVLSSISFGLGLFLGRKTIFTPASTLWNSTRKSVYTLVVPTLFSGLTTFSFVQAYARDRERLADQYAIKYAKSPEELEQEARRYENLATKNPAPLAIVSLLSTHPSDGERAEYFAEAAQNLRAKQKTPNS